MDPTPLHQIAQWAGGTLEGGNPELKISSLEKDSRSLTQGALYVALRGANFDGNRFLADAAARGAAAAMVDSPEATAPSLDFPLIRVENSLTALQQLASAWRDQLSLRVLALTGSSGKTSTKEFCASVLAQRFSVTKTEGNFNNHIGLPLSILKASSRDQMAVWEIGMNHPGEIEPLARLARPDFALVVNIGTAHIEFFGSRNAIAGEKGQILKALHPEGVAILNADDDFHDQLAAMAKPARVVSAGLSRGSIRAELIETTPAGMKFSLVFPGETVQVNLPTHGRHMVANAVLAAAAGREAGLSPEECAKGLAAAPPVKGRLQLREINGIFVLDDTYNANPDSVVAALAAMAEIPVEGRRIAILGRMGELGDYAEEGYRRTGAAAAKHSDLLITVGEDTETCAKAAREAGMHNILQMPDNRTTTEWLWKEANPGDLVLIKGSRSAAMETILEGTR
jgi:UDP-N-acetylmuramoyl-tripeptide--D-alanyl-D-alanine ligase